MRFLTGPLKTGNDVVQFALRDLNFEARNEFWTTKRISTQSKRHSNQLLPGLNNIIQNGFLLFGKKNRSRSISREISPPLSTSSLFSPFQNVKPYSPLISDPPNWPSFLIFPAWRVRGEQRVPREHGLLHELLLRGEVLHGTQHPALREPSRLQGQYIWTFWKKKSIVEKKEHELCGWEGANSVDICHGLSQHTATASTNLLDDSGLCLLPRRVLLLYFSRSTCHSNQPRRAIIKNTYPFPGPGPGPVLLPRQGQHHLPDVLQHRPQPAHHAQAAQLHERGPRPRGHAGGTPPRPRLRLAPTPPGPVPLRRREASRSEERIQQKIWCNIKTILGEDGRKKGKI